VADLPRGAVEVLGTSIAERGAPWNPSDDIDLSRPLPLARFIWARQSGCRLEIRYEQGGLARVRMAAILELRGRDWVVVRRQ
jgi:hypothetical protein